MWLNLGIAATLLIATIVGLYLAHRIVKGEGLPRLGGSREEPASTHAVDIQQIIAAYRKEKGAAGASLAVEVRATVKQPAPPPPALQAAVQATQVKPKASFLNGPNKLLFLVLKAALPDHQIFVNVRLVDAVQISGQPPTPQARAQLAQARVDFVICTKQLTVVALLDITDGNRADDLLKRQIEPQIAGAGGRYLRVAPNAIPKPAEARTLVCGAPS
jgi:hypothetical protein